MAAGAKEPAFLTSLDWLQSHHEFGHDDVEITRLRLRGGDGFRWQFCCQFGEQLLAWLGNLARDGSVQSGFKVLRLASVALSAIALVLSVLPSA